MGRHRSRWEIERDNELKEQKCRDRSRLKEQERKQKERARQEKETQKESEKRAKYEARTKLICEKKGIDLICCPEIVQEALEAGVAVSKISKVVVDGREDYWHKKTERLKKEKEKEKQRRQAEQRYKESLSAKCKVYIKNGHIHINDNVKFSLAIMADRPKLEEFDTCEITLNFLKRKQLADRREKEKQLTDLCQEKVEQKLLIDSMYDDFRRHVLKANPEVEEFDDCPIVVSYLKKTQLMYLCTALIDDETVLSRLSTSFIKAVLEEDPDKDKFDTCNVVKEYINQSKDIREDVDSRLEEHINNPIRRVVSKKEN